MRRSVEALAGLRLCQPAQPVGPANHLELVTEGTDLAIVNIRSSISTEGS